MPNRKTAEVVAYLNRHDVGFGNATVLRVAADGESITVRSGCTNGAGEPFSELETIPATVAAAREWLGY